MSFMKLDKSKILMLFLICFGFLYSSQLQMITIEVIASTFIEVIVFVAATLFIYSFLEKHLKFSFLQANSKAPLKQIIYAATMGLFPGCGGAIVVVSQFLQKKVSFASFIAVLCATMGDAAFLLLAQQPIDAIFVFAISWVTAIIFAYLIHLIHANTFDDLNVNLQLDRFRLNECLSIFSKPIKIVVFCWLILLIIGFFIAVNDLFFINIKFIERLFHPVGFLGGILTIILGFYFIQKQFVLKITTNLLEKFTKNIADISFVFTWVFFALFAFEFLSLYFNLTDDLLKNWIQSHALIYLPFIAVLFGFLPGCGPQILLTSLYLSGIIPFSSQVSNAISNDGDALFPAIALAPKTAFLASLYTSIPAIVVGYVIFYFEVS